MKDFKNYVCEALRENLFMHNSTLEELEDPHLYDLSNYSEYLDDCENAYQQHYDRAFKIDDFHEYDALQNTISLNKTN